MRVPGKPICTEFFLTKGLMKYSEIGNMKVKLRQKDMNLIVLRVLFYSSCCLCIMVSKVTLRLCLRLVAGK